MTRFVGYVVENSTDEGRNILLRDLLAYCNAYVKQLHVNLRKGLMRPRLLKGHKEANVKDILNVISEEGIWHDSAGLPT